MQRDERAYLHDVIEACEAIGSAVSGQDIATYRSNRLVRSAVEREFLIVGEAVSALSRSFPHLFTQITHARRIVDFRNRLAHEYSDVDDNVVWLIAVYDVPVLRAECTVLLENLGIQESS
jgi:uncharacterized protein with HEPN domain